MKEYSADFIYLVCQQLESGKSIDEVSMETGVKKKNIYHWRKEYAQLSKREIENLLKNSKRLDSLNLFDFKHLISGELNNNAVRVFRIATAILGLLAVIAETTAPGTFEFLDFDFIIGFTMFIQAIFALSIVIIGNPIPAIWSSDKETSRIANSSYFRGLRTKKATIAEVVDSLRNDFASNWINLWKTWFFFYSWLLALHIAEQKIEGFFSDCWQSSFFSWISNSLNILSAYFIYRIFLSLRYRHGVIDKYAKSKNLALFKLVVILLIVFEGLVILITTISNPELINSKAIIFQSDFITEGFSLKDLYALFEIAHSLLSGVVLAMLIGRFVDSYTVRFRYKNWILLGLYFYAAIQVLFPYISQESGNQYIGFLVVLVALFCKYLLYYVITSIIDKGIILFYALETRKFMSTIDGRIQMFRELWEQRRN